MNWCREDDSFSTLDGYTTFFLCSVLTPPPGPSAPFFLVRPQGGSDPRRVVHRLTATGAVATESEPS